MNSEKLYMYRTPKIRFEKRMNHSESFHIRISHADAIISQYVKIIKFMTLINPSTDLISA